MDEPVALVVNSTYSHSSVISLQKTNADRVVCGVFTLDLTVNLYYGEAYRGECTLLCTLQSK